MRGRTCSVSARWIAYLRGESAYDYDDLVPVVLETFELAQDDCVSEMQIGVGGVDPELDSQFLSGFSSGLDSGCQSRCAIGQHLGSAAEFFRLFQNLGADLQLGLFAHVILCVSQFALLSHSS